MSWLDNYSTTNTFRSIYINGFMDISGGRLQTRSVTDGHLLIAGDASLNGNLYVGGDISWNPNSLANDSIPSSAIIGGVPVGGVPVGSIMSYIGTTDPDGWVICDGVERSNNGVYDSLINMGIGSESGGNYIPPNLNDRFLYGTSSVVNIGDISGTNSVTLTSDNIPQHNHTGSTNTTGSHSHAQRTIHGHGGNLNNRAAVDEGGDNNIVNEGISTHNAGNHSHTFTTSTAYSANPTAFSIIPPSYRVFYILKY